MYISVTLCVCFALLSKCTPMPLTSRVGDDTNNQFADSYVEYNGSCDEECDQSSGCRGAGPGDCKACNHVFDSTHKICVKSCDNNTQYMYMHECLQCDEECLGCEHHATLHSVCLSCKRYKKYKNTHKSIRYMKCVAECDYYEFPLEDVCTSCHESCTLGCTGTGINDCKSCDKPALSYAKFEPVGCHLLNDTCPEAYFDAQLTPKLRDFGFDNTYLRTGHMIRACVICHPYCMKCTGFGFNNNQCQECVDKYKNCSCPSGFYFDVNYENRNDEVLMKHGVSVKGACKPCSRGCRECNDHGDCVQCYDTFYRVYEKGYPNLNYSFLCMDDCPSDQAYSNYDSTYQKYCSSSDGSQQYLIVNSVYVYSALVFIAGVLLLVFLIKMSKKIKYYKNQANKNEQTEPIQLCLPVNVTCTQTKLEIIKETDVRKTAILGEGAFGIVYKGFLILEDNRAEPVAIKVLQHALCKGASTKELLQEASVMASIDHPNLVRLLAICVTSNIMLVTQLMPLGDLHNYLLNNNNGIEPKTMLSWCTQIAQGMAHLQDRRLVHRDLAARNVLIQSVNTVKVSDFGLSRALGLDTDAYSSPGEKLPVRWMPLESLKTGKFTHKSDVWSLGVTVWEILTYAEEPYSVGTLCELVTYLEDGKRLHQPELCSTDLYSVLMSCWAHQPEERPSFDELIDIFSKMAEDPERFVIVLDPRQFEQAPELLPRQYYLEYRFPDDLKHGRDYVNVEMSIQC